MKMSVKRVHCHMYLDKERRLSSTQGKKSNSHERGLGRAEGRYKHVGVGERRGAGRSNAPAGTAGRRKQDMDRSRILGSGDLLLMAPALLPESSPAFITQWR